MGSIRITCQAIFALTCVVACFIFNSAETQTELPAIHNLDREFLIQAAQINLYELAAAELAEKTTKRLDLKKLAEKTLIDKKLNDNNIKLIASKRNVTLPLEPNTEQQRNLYVLSGLKGDAFDNFFLTVGAGYQFNTVEQYKRTAERSLDMDVKTMLVKLCSI
jgi:putative membrane protein